ncbi:peptidoglycan-binding domain-containing protein [Streptomyces boninensis]|uniref:peptidoglycan-binding domain-containing protein n=1 Tax=Streptomyces boninensis TaxID=2039455 RepID=UPI003B22794B
MRSASKRALVGATALLGITAGSLAGASAGLATSAPAARPAASAAAGDVSVRAVNNLGLDYSHARRWQCYLRDTGYKPGTLDGQLGTNSWRAAQQKFNDLGLRAGAEDGIVGTNTIKALQRYLNKFGAGLAVDGIAGPQTKFAFWRYTGGLRYC